MKFSRGKILVSVLCFILGIMFMISGVFVTVARKMNRSIVGTIGREESSGCHVMVSGIKKIGNAYSVTYGDEIITYTTDFVDYTIYEITFSVTNEGIEELYSVDPGIFISGKDYSDVYDLWMGGPSYDETPLFYYDSEPYVPAYSTAEVKKYVQVKDGVTELTVSYFPGDDYTEEEFLTLRLD